MLPDRLFSQLNHTATIFCLHFPVVTITSQIADWAAQQSEPYASEAVAIRAIGFLSIKVRQARGITFLMRSMDQSPAPLPTGTPRPGMSTYELLGHTQYQVSCYRVLEVTGY